MSVQATSWVWDKAHVNGHELLVLLAIADSCNREGEEACQSISTLAAMARISERTCYRIVGSLRDEGWIEKTGVSGRYKTSVYRLAQMKIGPITAPPEDDVTPDTSDTCQEVTPDKSDARPLSPVADEPTTYPRTTQVVPSTEVLMSKGAVVNQHTLDPEIHPSRVITSAWAPRPHIIRALMYIYPDVNVRECGTRFVAFHIARQDTSRSWEAAFQAWVSRDAETVREKRQGGTDDLGVPLNQKRGSSVPEVQPGDPDYVDPEEIIALAISEAQKRPRNKS